MRIAAALLDGSVEALAAFGAVSPGPGVGMPRAPGHRDSPVDTASAAAVTAEETEVASWRPAGLGEDAMLGVVGSGCCGSLATACRRLANRADRLLGGFWTPARTGMRVSEFGG